MYKLENMTKFSTPFILDMIYIDTNNQGSLFLEFNIKMKMGEQLT